MKSVKTSVALAVVAALAACGGSDDSGPVALACTDFGGKTITGAAVSGEIVVAATATAPEYCRVQATLPTKLKFELRMPSSGWNGKLMYGGADSVTGSSGGFNGAIPKVNVAALSNRRHRQRTRDQGAVCGAVRSGAAELTRKLRGHDCRGAFQMGPRRQSIGLPSRMNNNSNPRKTS